MQKTEEQKITLSVSDLSLAEVARVLASEYGVSVVCDESLSVRRVALEVIDQPVSEVVAAVARRVGSDVTRKGSLWVIGPAKASDRGVLVFRCGELEPEKLKEVVDLLLSDLGRCAVSDDGLAVVGDRVEVLERVSAAAEGMRNESRSVWLVQLHVLDSSASIEKSIGVDGAASVSGAVSFPGSASGSGAMSLALAALRDDRDTEVLAEPLCVVNDGSPYTFRSGDTYAIVERSVGERADLQTVRQEQAGFVVNVSVRSLGGERAVLECAVSDSVVTGTAERPSTRGYELRSTIDVVSGRTYLVGSAVRSGMEESSALGLLVLRKSSASQRRVDVFARVYRVSGLSSELPPLPVVEPPRSGLSAAEGLTTGNPAERSRG